MTTSQPNIQPKRSRAARIALFVTSAITGVLALGFIAAGALALYGNTQKDRDGYLSTSSERFEAGTRALATQNLDVNLDGTGSVVSTGEFGKVRLKVAPQSGKPVFVGIARSSDVAGYLRGVPHTTLTDVESSPFKATYRPHGGKQRPAAPAKQSIWAASAHGKGTQTLNRDVQDGDWSVVVMNADGSPGVQAGISAGAKAPWLNELGWTSAGGGTILLIIAAGLLMLGIRPPRNGSDSAPATTRVMPVTG
jgi:hypothetical protein